MNISLLEKLRHSPDSGDGTGPFGHTSRRSSIETRPHLQGRQRRSQSSPVRFEQPKEISRCRPRSPSVSPLRRTECNPNYFPAILYGVPETLEYYSPRPPVRPVYLVPLPTRPPPIAVPSTPPLTSRYLLQPDIAKAKKIEARFVVHYVVRRLVNKITSLEISMQPECARITDGDQTFESKDQQRDMAVQVYSDNSAIDDTVSQMQSDCRQNYDEEKGICQWVGSVRALRDSHMRLLLRQLRLLRHIDRLNRTIRRSHPHKHSTVN